LSQLSSIKSSLAKNYKMSPLLCTIFNFVLNYVLLFLKQHVGLSTSYFYNKVDDKVFATRNGVFLEKEFLSKEVSESNVQLEEI
jgi:hypothetical protein